jgi:hypothetical protein
MMWVVHLVTALFDRPCSRCKCGVGVVMAPLHQAVGYSE